MKEPRVEVGRLALARLRARAPELAEQALAGCEERIPALAAQPGRLRAEGLRVIEFALASAFELAADQAPLGPGHLRVLQEYFDGAAARGIPLGLQLHVIDATLAVGFQAWWASADADGVEGLLALSRWVMANLPELQRCAVQAYCTPHTPAPPGVLADILLAGLDPRAALGAGDIAPAHLVVAPADRGPAPGALAGPGLPELLSGWRDGRSVALVPVVEPARPDDLVAAVRDALRGVRGPDDRPLVVGAALAGPYHEIPRAADEALRVAELAAAVPGAAGMYLSEDVLLEKAVGRAPGVLDEFGEMLAGLEGSPELLPTLRTLYDVELDRTRAAAVLGVNRRTLTNRLNRIEAITGVRPTSPRGIQMLMTAMTVGSTMG